MLGMATIEIRRSIAPENSAGFSFVSTDFKRCRTARNAHAEATPCARNVAHATPPTPQWNTMTNTASSAILPTDDAIKNHSGVLLSPSDVNTPEEML